MTFDKLAVEKTTDVRKYLAGKGTPIGLNGTMIAGNAWAAEWTAGVRALFYADVSVARLKEEKRVLTLL